MPDVSAQAASPFGEAYSPASMGQAHRNLWWAGDVPMTDISRTAYPRFTRAPSVKELREIYTPTSGDIAFVATRARGPSQKFALMILLKVYQRLHYFPDPQTIPGAVISHIRAVMKLPADLVPDIAQRRSIAITWPYETIWKLP